MTDKLIDFSLESPAREKNSKEFLKSRWKPFRKWFFKNFNKEKRICFQEEFYKDLFESKQNVLIAFVPWFITKHVHSYISMIERDYKEKTSDKINKISEKYARKLVQQMYYYPRPTPQDVLLEEHEHKEIYEWNIDGRWFDNSETIRTMLQNLRCKTLTSFKFYKDVFLCRVMELTECNSSHWKFKKTLRGDSQSINYDNYTYGKLISACLNQQVKRHRLNERQQLGELCEQFALDIPKASSKDRKHSSKNKSSKKDYKARKKRRIEKKERRAESYKEKRRFNKSSDKFGKSDTCHRCGRFGHYAKGCNVRNKINHLNIEDNIKDSLCKILLNSESEETDAGYSSYGESSSNEDRALDQENCMISDSECLPCQQGPSCDNKEGDDLYKIYSLIKLLQIVKDLEIRAQIIDKIGEASTTSGSHIEEDNILAKERSYTMSKVKKLLHEKRKLISTPTTIWDLKEEINNLKSDIQILNKKNVAIENRLNNIESQKGHDSSSESSYEDEGDSFLQMLKMINELSSKLISKNQQVNFIKDEINNIGVDTILQNSKLQENISFLKNQFSLKICGDHPNEFWNRKKHVVGLPYEDNFNNSNIPTKARPCQMNFGYLELCKKEINSLLKKGLIRHSKLLAANIASRNDLNTYHPMYKEFLDFMQSKQGKHYIPQTYSTVLIDEKNIEIFDQNDKKEAILLLEKSYTTPAYKYKMHYKMILSATGSGEFQHFYPVNTKKVYNFSKIIIKRVMAPEE
ncbi:hypothetical protein H5410_050612 [Solanum commersonii]|uniref:CCHC-type domain-containing protein n=1 Tax=Solanum commersonii TaxID=4109 RepID=A0A9J5WVY3_SOLCO|nr:hypothetical protein H5410_050612 [Solanum commersonii]